MIKIHVVLVFISGGMRHLILCQEGALHTKMLIIGAMELLTLEELGKKKNSMQSLLRNQFK
jgi:hypothetical protein